jgi:acyl-CoA reductase-like NAD-dependent aldehyde dehydrogenase
MREEGARRGTVLLDSRTYPHPEFPAARTATPLLLALGKEARDLYATEQFGPIAFVVACDSAEDALAQATRDARENGGITGFVYATDEGFIAAAEAAYAQAGAQLTVNLTGPMPLNFAAAYSDYHVTGLNGAGNATLTTLAFVASRFAVAQSRRPAGDRHV